jgi:hypothetical protein
MKYILKTLKYAAITVLTLILILGMTIFYMWIRPNSSEVNPEIITGTWVAVTDGMHNSNTHMISWKDEFLSMPTRRTISPHRNASSWSGGQRMPTTGQRLRS